jgi:hypothetical protein
MNSKSTPDQAYKSLLIIKCTNLVLNIKHAVKIKIYQAIQVDAVKSCDVVAISLGSLNEFSLSGIASKSSGV